MVPLKPQKLWWELSTEYLDREDYVELKTEDYDRKEDEKEMESAWHTLKQMIIPFIVASMGSVCAGIVLNNVQYWPVFTNIPQMMIMLPAFMGLTGNIETTFASRMSTHSNLGTHDVSEQFKQMVIGNMALIHCQASSAGLFASLVSLAVGKVIGEGSIDASSMLTMTSSAILSCLIVNIVVSTIIILIVIIARIYRANPDNVATPVAASVGDIISVYVLSEISEFLYQKSKNSLLIPIIIVSCYAIYAPIMTIIARRFVYTKDVIKTGWLPILGAVLIEQIGGVFMQNAFSKYAVMSTFQPAVNAVGNNLSGVQSSRLSTFLHQNYPPKTLPNNLKLSFVSPLYVYFRCAHASLLRLLLAVCLPVQLVYLIILRVWQNNFVFTAPFLIAYFMAVFINVFVLLYISYNFVLFAWRRGFNPDNSTIPVTSAIADALGNCSMAAVFTILNLMADPNAQYNNVGNATEVSNFTLNVDRQNIILSITNLFNNNVSLTY